MAQRIDLITDQDLQAFADGELDGDRLEAVAARLEVDGWAASRALSLAARADHLRARAASIYEDGALKNVVDSLITKRSMSLESPSSSEMRSRKTC